MSDAEDVKTEAPEEEEEKPVFKKKLTRNLRQRRDSVGDAELESCALEEIKERQKLRQRQKGVSVLGLALGKKLTQGEESTIKDPFNVKTGGLVNMQALKSGKIKETVSEDAYDVGIGTQFSAETNKRDEDEEMMKYIEQELQKRKGLLEANTEADEADVQKYMTPEEAALYSLPEHLRLSSSNRSEEMLSNQMLNGIPEVDLGIEAKIRNIEATEDAKQKLLQDQRNKKDGPSQFVPTNMAVNFMQHNRFNIEDSSEPRRRRREAEQQQQQQEQQQHQQQQPQQQQQRHQQHQQHQHQHSQQQQQQQHHQQQPHQQQHSHNQMGPNGLKRATDDYHYDKFKKQFRRY